MDDYGEWVRARGAAKLVHGDVGRQHGGLRAPRILRRERSLCESERDAAEALVRTAKRFIKAYEEPASAEDEDEDESVG